MNEWVNKIALTPPPPFTIDFCSLDKRFKLEF